MIATDIMVAAHGSPGSFRRRGALRALKAKLNRAIQVALTTPCLYLCPQWQRRLTARLLNYAPTEALRGLSPARGLTVAVSLDTTAAQ